MMMRFDALIGVLFIRICVVSQISSVESVHFNKADLYMYSTNYLFYDIITL
jgi:hypothetical protein